MSADALPVVRIKSDAPGHQPDGFVEINARDFDAAVHQLFDQPKPAPTPPVQSRAAKATRKE